MSRLDLLCKQFNKNCNSDVVQMGIKEFDVEKIPFSSPRANYATYGGIPRGRLVEFYGAEGGGKTTSALDICANAQKLFEKEEPNNPKKILFVDAENTLDSKWATKLGVDCNKMLIVKPEAQSAEELFQFVLDVIDTGEVGLVVFDSLGVLVSQQAYDKDISERTYGGISMPLTTFSKKATMLCQKTNCTVLAINQIRDNLSSMYGGTVTCGGRAWRHNCFGGNTRFLTDKGLRRFRDCKDGESVVVVDKDGNLRDATVHYYGKGALNHVKLRTPNMTHEIVCSPDHTWILADGTTTTNLSVGDHLYIRPANTPIDVQTQRQAEMFCLGMIIADGCDHKGKNGNYIQAQLYGDKKRFSSVFELANYSKACLNDGSLVYKKLGYSKQAFLSGGGWKWLSAEDKRFLFFGYYSGDGAVGGCSCVTYDERVLEFIQDTCGMAGYFLTSIEHHVATENSFNPGAQYYRVRFTTHQSKTNHWVVESIRKTTENGLYCVEEPVTHTFTLEKGIVTGNCSLRIEFKRGDFFDEKNNKVNQSCENPAGNLIQFSIIKSKVFANNRKTGFMSLNYLKGIDYISDTLDVCMRLGYVVQAGAWYSVIDPDTGEQLEKFQGRPAVIDFLTKNNELYDRYTVAISKYIQESD